MESEKLRSLVIDVTTIRALEWPMATGMFRKDTICLLIPPDWLHLSTWFLFSIQAGWKERGLAVTTIITPRST